MGNYKRSFPRENGLAGTRHATFVAETTADGHPIAASQADLDDAAVRNTIPAWPVYIPVPIARIDGTVPIPGSRQRLAAERQCARQDHGSDPTHHCGFLCTSRSYSKVSGSERKCRSHAFCAAKRKLATGGAPDRDAPDHRPARHRARRRAVCQVGADRSATLSACQQVRSRAMLRCPELEQRRRQWRRALISRRAQRPRWTDPSRPRRAPGRLSPASPRDC